MNRVALFGVLAAVSANLAPGQTGAGKPEFDAASIRPSAADARGGGFNLSPGRLNAKNRSLNELVKFAYGLQDYQLSGGPGWADTARYEILASFSAPFTNDRRAAMMQSMLADRFALAIHRESKEISGYALVRGRNGAKLHAAESAGHGMMLGRNPASGQRTLHGNRAGMADLASMLADLLGRPVEDRTGLGGIFDFVMEWTPDPVGEGSTRTGAEKQDVSADGQTGPSIFTALQEQLGLKLDTAKAAVEVVVIDHAEKPSGN